MSASTIEFTINSGVAHITLNDPTSRNALSMTMIDRILLALDEAVRDARVVVIGGAGGTFCSGANLASGNAPADKGVDASGPIVSHFNPLMLKLHRLPIPYITAVRGAAAGFGASLALSGDLVIASETAFFIQSFCNIGLVPDGGAAVLLVQSIGRIKATELMLLGDRLPAAKAHDWGLITRVVPDSEFDESVEKLARKLADGPTIALGMIRQMARNAGSLDYEDQLTLEVANQRRAGNTADYREGVAAFLAKRPPAFTGR